MVTKRQSSAHRFKSSQVSRGLEQKKADQDRKNNTKQLI
jgi:hypothetical protein